MPRKGQKVIRSPDAIVSYDTPEQIKQCTHCPYAECSNCLVNKRNRKKVDTFDLSLLSRYSEALSDNWLARNLNTSFDRIIRHRVKLGLPDPAKLSRTEKEKIVKEKMGA